MEANATNERIPDDYPLGPDSLVQEGVPQGTVTKYHQISSIYPGVPHDYYVYVPVQYNPAVAANVMVFTDGSGSYLTDKSMDVPTVFNNLIHKRDMPVTIGIFIDPGANTEAYLNDPREAEAKYPESQRAAEYDVLNDGYARFLLEEILPEVGKLYNLTDDPNGRGICGLSSGGICSWTVAWERPDAFRKVLSFIGSFADIRGGHIYPFLIRKTEMKPIRAFLQAGSADLNCVWGDWPLCNLQMESALDFKGYDYKFVMGDGGHTHHHGASILPDALRWLWRAWLLG